MFQRLFTSVLSAQVLFVALLIQFPHDCSGENWGHWRGESGNGVSSVATPPTEWSDTKNVKWKVAVPGRGSGSPVIWEDNIFVVTAVKEGEQPEQPAPTADEGNRPQGRRRRGGRRRGGPIPNLAFKLLCYDKSTGDLKWEKTATIVTPHEGTHSTNGYSSASPCTDGEHVYAHFGSRGLYCYTLDGELKWQRDDLGKMQTRAGFGEGSSPVIHGDKIVVPWDHEGASALFALDKSTGKTIWKTERDEPTCWATPLIVEHDGKHQVIMNGQNFARSYDLETGDEIWKCGGQTERPVACPVTQDGLVIVGSGHRGSFMGAFRLGGTGDIEETDDVVWTVDRDTPDIGSPILSGGRLYFYKGKAGILTCLDAATGKPHFSSERLPGMKNQMIYASPVAAGGHVFLTSRNGTTVVIRDSEQLEVVATNSVGETVDATPAPVGNELFIRGEKHLFCIAAE